MVKRAVFLSIFLFFLLLAQASILPHFSFKGISPNIFVLTIVLVCLFSKKLDIAFASAIVSGFYLDIYSFGKTGFFGFYTLAMLGLAFFLRLVIRKYVQFPLFK